MTTNTKRGEKEKKANLKLETSAVDLNAAFNFDDEKNDDFSAELTDFMCRANLAFIRCFDGFNETDLDLYN